MIEIFGLRSEYFGKTVLDINRLVLEEGCITAVVGLNGSGKSTLLKSIVGNVDYKGSIFVDGKDVSLLGYKKRAREIGYLPQEHLSVNIDVYTLVSHGRFPYKGFYKVLGKRDQELIEKALKLTDLWEKKDCKVSDLSGGERQRAYLAMVIAQDTKMLLLDEPETFMDIKHQTEISDVLKVLAKEGRGIVITSHDLPQSFSVCSKVCLLKDGKIAAEGTAEEVVRKEGLLEKVMGVSLKKDEDKEALFKYKLTKIEKKEKSENGF